MRTDVPRGPYGDGALPNLIVAGYSKCGTTSIHRYLDLHPEVAMSRVKELGFFCDRADAAALTAPEDRALAVNRGNFSRGVEWYRSHFDPAARWRGETTPAYTVPWYPDAPARLGELLPDARILLCVRDPVERAISRYRFTTVRALEHRTDVEQITDPDGYYVRGTEYSGGWERLRKSFGAEQIFVLETECLAVDPATALNEVFAWLGLPEITASAELEHRWNRTASFTGAGNRVIERLRRFRGWGQLAERVPVGVRAGWERTLSIGSREQTAPEPLLAELRDRFAERLRPDAERMRRLTGRRFSRWSI